ncbi:unnamed protein product [Callosobruchus maculatus]|uniref:Uncharacterized protein n=1 Tax=Callosobruchus maculatus TaxID=64391 RepID=A0A653DFT9_CALMS|nr:unnamed protein product [Callosobruchus maculatus]
MVRQNYTQRVGDTFRTCINMGDRIQAGVIVIFFSLTNAATIIEKVQVEKTPQRLVREAEPLIRSHSAVPDRLEQSYSVANPSHTYQFNVNDAPKQYSQPEAQFSSIESIGQLSPKDFDTDGYDLYKSATSFNLEGPKQLETIHTNSYHKEVGPYDTSEFKHRSEVEEQHAEVHYHQHKHLHKHNHHQDHVHKHEQHHAHQHEHGHQHKQHHHHDHHSSHKHDHYSEHKHSHKADHHHQHEQKHKHSHHSHHDHGHKHEEGHKHEGHHSHKHHHHNDHKHSHYSSHKHEHGHSHKHSNHHKHDHHHSGHHKHHHDHHEEYKVLYHHKH